MIEVGSMRDFRAGGTREASVYKGKGRGGEGGDPQLMLSGQGRWRRGYSGKCTGSEKLLASLPFSAVPSCSQNNGIK